MLSALLVDDHPHLVEHLSTVIPWAELGVAQVHTGCSGDEALETIRNNRIDILVTDIRMPGMDGLQLIGQARELRPEIGCILLSGYGEFQYAQKAIELQAFRYLLKPVRPDEFISVILELTGRRGRPSDAGKGQAAELRPADKHEVQRRLVDSVHDYVRLHIGGDLTLAVIAEHVYLHPVYLSKVYKEITGTNMSEFILDARMAKARELLKQSGLRIYEIGEAVGYRSTQHFIAEFKKYAGLTPKQFRETAD
ncbi:response regulator [Paenibacillus sp. GYB004]|uniref:response regulator transcription factor n=1 Tax=Paenibacillus sp. GYB004 TaxID=2994393 RepID=UPI002F961283